MWFYTQQAVASSNDNVYLVILMCMRIISCSLHRKLGKTNVIIRMIYMDYHLGVLCTVKIWQNTGITILSNTVKYTNILIRLGQGSPLKKRNPTPNR